MSDKSVLSDEQYKQIDDSHRWDTINGRIAAYRAVAEATIAADRERCAMKLTKPAKVGAATFGVGVSERMVIEAAQRQYEYSLNPEPEKIGAIKRLMDTDREQRKPAAPAVPEGWVITRCDDGEIVITHNAIGGVVVNRNPRHAREIPESILWALADAMLAAAPAPSQEPTT